MGNSRKIYATVNVMVPSGKYFLSIELPIPYSSKDAAMDDDLIFFISDEGVLICRNKGVKKIERLSKKLPIVHNNVKTVGLLVGDYDRMTIFEKVGYNDNVNLNENEHCLTALQTFADFELYRDVHRPDMSIMDLMKTQEAAGFSKRILHCSYHITTMEDKSDFTHHGYLSAETLISFTLNIRDVFAEKPVK